MIVPDLNLLILAHNERAMRHERARDWWRGCLNGTVTVGLPWACVLGFVRLTTGRHVLAVPLQPTAALQRVRAWMERPQVRIVAPGARHLQLLEGLMTATGVTGSLMTDAHLAALAIENQAELQSNDADFARFPGLRWRDPTA